jgi:hypothetical protein
LLLYYFEIGVPCDKDGHVLPQDALPQPRCQHAPDDWSPYTDRIEFELADFIYRRNQMSAPDINDLMDIWAAQLFKYGDHPPFADHRDLYNTVDATPLADVRWQTFTANYQGERPDDAVPPWMDAEYDVWFRDPLAVVRELVGNPDFDGEFDYTPFREFEANGERRLQDFFSGDWAWSQAVRTVLHSFVPASHPGLEHHFPRRKDARLHVCTSNLGE